MTKYGKSAGFDVVWLEYYGELISDFEPKHELIVDDIVSMEQELEQTKKRLAELEEAIRIIPDWGGQESDIDMRHAIECAKAYASNNHNTKGEK